MYIYIYICIYIYISMEFGNHILNNLLLGVLRPGIHLPRPSLLQGDHYLHN